MLTKDNTAMILVDYQGKLASVMDEHDRLHENILKLTRGLHTLGVPIIWLEQYPKGLGPTNEEVRNILSEDNEPFAKVHFSGYRDADVKAALDKLNKDNIIVAGIEAHVCVYQTVKDLLKIGKSVEYVADAISSRMNENKQIAMSKMNLLGAMPTSVEMILFELMETATHTKFKDISQLIK